MHARELPVDHAVITNEGIAVPMGFPRVMFVMGKGGVGRSTVSTALALTLAHAGARVLILEWTVADPIASWFGSSPAGETPKEIAPCLHVMNYKLQEALRAYFVDHLRWRRFYRRIVRGDQVQQLISAAPGFAELLFLGQLWWITTLAEQEAGWHFDRVIIDAPATGHGSALLDFPSTLSAFRAGGLLGFEVERVAAMMGDPAWTDTMVVTLAEELVVQETMALVPCIAERLGRPPWWVVVNRSMSTTVDASVRPEWFDRLATRFSPGARASLEALLESVRMRVALEQQLGESLRGQVRHGVVSVDEQLARLGDRPPGEIVRAVADQLASRLRVSP